MHKGLTKIKDNPIKGDVKIGDFCIVGSNTVIMPNNRIPEGVAIGALSFIPQNFSFKSWSVYAGTPIKFIKKREKKFYKNLINLKKLFVMIKWFEPEIGRDDLTIVKKCIF